VAKRGMNTGRVGTYPIPRHRNIRMGDHSIRKSSATPWPRAAPRAPAVGQCGRLAVKDATDPYSGLTPGEKRL
jgi:hypothetical protein